MATAIITPRNDGPYHIKGDFKITTQGGKEIEVTKDEVWLCRCGHSHNKPFCDGSHKKAGFRSDLDEEPQEGQTPDASNQ
ncbi:CDGSH iron-sulfur domain-containing protein [Paraburkholderia panacisoli]|uniref:CDGSH iron-sulfur domain-containing protein n=1 Tax=Paraburkholderia panacisoli TaxID=2603818 RepID=A0A5B0H393_9BURK|nr:CDGSH iron-sulfur domain-containing protein [Paraburkholderia panacisoli]KAA1009697.1 CDGSH iron-sulfur domain-containing protein [Paraburkholderia panacisoli]